MPHRDPLPYRPERPRAPGCPGPRRGLRSALFAALLLVLVPAPACFAATGDDAAPKADIDPPGEPTSASQKVAELIRAGKRPEALALAESELAHDGHDARLLFQRGTLLTDLGRTEEAIGAFERMTQEFPELPEAYNNIGVLRAGRGELSQAERYLRLAISVRPDYVTAEENLGDLYVALARGAYERGSQMNPASRTLREKLALARDLGAKIRAAH